MKILGKRRSYNLWPLRINKTGFFTVTSVTVDLIFWRGVIWERGRRR